MSRPAGRPRDPTVDERILEVTLDLLAREGYSRMGMDQVARQAGVSKPTIYRRWSGKADLVTAALRSLQLAEPPVHTGSVRGDLIGTLENFRRSLLRPQGMALIGMVLTEEQHNPDLMTHFRERLVAPRRGRLRELLARAQKQGELPAEADLEAAVTTLVGAFYAHYLADPDVGADWPARVVSLVWDGLT